MPLNKTVARIKFNYLKPLTFRQRNRTKELVVTILKEAGLEPGSINYIFCSDEYLREINRTHLQHDYYTDIITFDLSNDSKLITSDIFISVDRVRDNARTFKRPFQEELRRVIFHGALHLAGCKDSSQPQRQQMRAMEEKYLAIFNSV